MTEAERQSTVLMGVASGLETDVVLGLAEVDEKTFTGWLENDKAFSDRMSQARAAARGIELSAAGVLRRAASEDPAAALRFLLDKQAARELERTKELTTY